MSQKWVYLFGPQGSEGSAQMKDLLGGKGANLAEMSSLGLPVPPGMTVSTGACLQYNEKGALGDEIKEQIRKGVKSLEQQLGKEFGSESNPLLLSVRSGARVSMPGMMDTILNLGLNDKTVLSLAEQSGDDRFAWDAYRRFIAMFSNVVLGVDYINFEDALEMEKQNRGVLDDSGLSADSLKTLSHQYLQIVKTEKGISFPQEPFEQLWAAVGAVFNSWANKRAVRYRELHGYSHDWGTAVTVQSMVFGNMGETSGTGVCFTRHPSTGAPILFGEFLMNAQGEDVVAGIRTPGPINEASKSKGEEKVSLESLMPDVYAELCELKDKLENHYQDMQDIEFTIERGRLFVLQTRNGKRTAQAALKICCDFVKEKRMSKKQAVAKVDALQIERLLHPQLDRSSSPTPIAKGLPASPGAVSGQIVFSSEKAEECAKKGVDCLLLRTETSPEDIGGMIASKGILTSRGGMTSHAAVVARGMGKSCIVGLGQLVIQPQELCCNLGGKTFREGDLMTFDGNTGEVFEGEIPTRPAQLGQDFHTFFEWVDEFRELQVRANADNAEDCAQAIEFGAEGIGLCRTEHMFFAPERIQAVREMIFSETEKDRQKAIDKIRPFQRKDFEAIFVQMRSRPSTIRLLDPPLHEFLPHREQEKKALCDELGLSERRLQTRLDQLSEHNPMLGHRGCRLGLSYPEIYQMQVKAMTEAALNCIKQKIPVNLEIMVPLICGPSELKELREIIQDQLPSKKDWPSDLSIQIGTMIELPRAALLAREIAEHADFFSFGTNDLTQTTMGISRDDASSFLPHYIEKGLFSADPFQSIDQQGVGLLVDKATREGRKRKALKCGVCGEHGGDPASVDFFHRTGLDYVSCSPFRVPIARLAAAQAALKAKAN